MNDYISYEDSTRFFYEVFDENGNCENKFICIETVTSALGTNSDQTQTTIKIYSVPIYDYRHDTYVHCNNDTFIADVWFVNSSKSLVNKKYSHIDVCKSNFTTLIDIFRSITYVNPSEIQTLVNKKLLLHSDHHFLPPGLTETELQNFIKSNWSQIYNSDYNYEFFHSSGANSGIMREVHNVKVERNTVTDKYRYTTEGKSKSNITPSTITVDSVNHTYTGNNITLAISGNSVSVKNTKTSTNRTTELQNFIKSNWSQKFWKDINVSYAYARELGYVKNMPEVADRGTYRITIRLTRLTSQISVNNNDWYYDYITYADDSGYSETDRTKSGEYISGRAWWPAYFSTFLGTINIYHRITLFRSNNNLIWSRDLKYTYHGSGTFSGLPSVGEHYDHAAAVCW